MKTTVEVSIFIVEDDPHFRETFIDVMSLRGVEVRAAASAEEGLEMLRFCRPSIILLDINLPGMDGLALCRRLKSLEAFKETPIIFVSASTKYNDKRDQVEGLIAGAAGFLPKPITMDRLWSEIEPLLKRR